MKRLLLAFAVAMMAVSTVSAQEWRDENRWHDPFDIYAGPVAGVVASNLTNYDGKYMFGPYIGGMVQTYFNNHFGMSFEIAYTRQGVRDGWASFVEDENTIAGPYEYRFDYINNIYKVRYYPVKPFNVFTGLSFGVHVGAKCELNGKTINIRDDVRKRTAHILGGVGYEMDNLYFEGYYGLPLSKIARTDRGKKALHDAKEQIFVLTVGYRFKVY